jgi:ATP-dependent DNA ligase
MGDKVKLVCQIKNYKGTVENAVTKGYVDITEQAPQGIENITLTEKAKKVVVDGNVYIIRNNKMYDLTGAQVR